MSRYKIPQKPGSKYITPEGKIKLHAEFKFLWSSKRPEVTAALAAAAAEGDRSENAEYIYRKKQLREIDARIHHLKERLDHIVVVDSSPNDTSRVFFGAWVRLEDEEGTVYDYRIVGPDEFEPAKGLISIDSPLARALMKKTVGDEVVVKRPRGDAVFTICRIQYGSLENSDKG
ncbi:MAG TPA: transcription elongation factor GreB [Nitrospirota bacterium]|nr:transcription elongation factor GreB [Nitrospirota bacterium]